MNDTQDSRLERVAARLGAAAADLRALLAGIAAAPPRPPDAWLPLVTPAGDGAAVRDDLVALVDALAPAPDPTPLDARPDAVRAAMHEQGVDAFVVPHADEHQGEWVPARAERLAWLTGFTGSAGTAVILPDGLHLFVDGRYTLQAERQVPATVTRHDTENEQPHAWLGETLAADVRLGYDPWLHTENQRRRLHDACHRAGAVLVPVAANPVDAAWTAQPPAPVGPVGLHDDSFAGRPAADKRREAGATLTDQGEAAAVLAAPESIAWLLNLRGGDVPYTPVFRAFAVLHADGAVALFVDRRKLLPGAADALEGVTLHPPDALAETLDALARDGARVRVDPDGTPVWIVDRLRAGGADVRTGADPCRLPRARKTGAELDGARAAHRRDGIALARFLAWLDEQAGDGAMTELSAARHLAAQRAKGEHYAGLSFPTISAVGANAAVVHYVATPETDAPLTPGNLYLVDSGGQYRDGTTDVTRTVAVGDPPPEAVRAYTLALKGHMALARQRFPRGTRGGQLDALARTALWEAGLDYDHGTGHGVGSFLGVHEGPQRLSKRPDDTPLEPGMILSIEPGYYRAGAFGLRIENLAAVVPDPREGDERDMLGFEILTLAPLDPALIDPARLTRDETAWLAAYHARVHDTLAPLLDAETGGWLAAVTAAFR